MKSIKYFFFILISALTTSLSAQTSTGTLDLQILQNVQTFPLSNFLNFSEGFDLKNTNLPVMMNLTITANVPQVELRGNMYWTSTDDEFAGEVFNFISDPVTLEGSGPYTLIVNNTEFGSGKKVDIREGTTNSDLIEENAKRGTLSGTYIITMELYEVDGFTPLASDVETLVATNPVANFSIDEPTGVTQDGFVLSWTPIQGPEGYIVAVTEMMLSSYNDIESSSPNVNDEVQINTAGIGSMVPILRAFTPGVTYYVSVFARVPTMFEGYEYYPAENNNLPITIPAASTGSTGNFAKGNALSPTMNPDFDEETGYVAPVFSITEPVIGSSFEVSNKKFATTITWDEVNDATSYKVVVNYVGLSGSAEETNARASALTNTTVVPGQNLASINVTSGNTKSISVDLSNASIVPQINNTYLTIGIFATNTDGTWRSSNVRFVLLTEPQGEGESAQQQQEEDVSISAFQQILNQPGVTIDSATDEDGNTYSQQDIQNLITEIMNGTVSGTLRVVTRTSSGGNN